MKFDDHYKECRERINFTLEKLLPKPTEISQNLHKAMHYAVMNGGKRLRPFLIYIVGEAFGVSKDKLDSAASAIEFIHSGSLVHDDLPAMDNDTLRRGKPTCYIAFDEATAILVGDSLFFLAFEVINKDNLLTSEMRSEISNILAKSSGSRGMCGGQDLDILSVKNPLNFIQLEEMYRLKTGALLSACVAIAAVVADIKDQTIVNLLQKFAEALGLAFQIQDDILDIEGESEKLGKNIHSDKRKGKITYPELVGLDKAKEKVRSLRQEATDAIKQIAGQTRLVDDNLYNYQSVVFAENDVSEVEG